jgi:hypothetical protein
MLGFIGAVAIAAVHLVAPDIRNATVAPEYMNFPPPANVSHSPGLGIVNGRTTTQGEWEGVVMVIGGNGDCLDLGLCSGAFIHPQIVMTAGHCCEPSEKKAICGGKDRTQPTKLGEEMEKAVLFTRFNDFCLVFMDKPVNDVPIYEVATEVKSGQDGTIVGYGVYTSGYPQ